MRFLHLMVLTVALALFSGCAPLPPFNLNPATPDLKLSSKRPQKIAVVVQDPMPYTIFYKGEGGYRRDMTADCRTSGFMLERDLSRIASETLSQAFKQVVVVRDLPQPGQYDASINLDIGEILMKEHVIITGETCDVTADWKMSVLDANNREIFNKSGVSPSHNFKWSVITPDRDFIIGMNATLSLILTEMAQEWGTTLNSLDIPAAPGAGK